MQKFIRGAGSQPSPPTYPSPTTCVVPRCHLWPGYAMPLQPTVSVYIQNQAINTTVEYHDLKVLHSHINYDATQL